MNLGKKLINLRKQEKMTQEKFAETIGVTRQTISNWELNTTKPDLNQIEKISKLFHISIDELLDNDVQNIIVEKIYKTEKIVNKNTKTIKVLVITIYFVILISLISIMVYYLTKKDFTTYYQTEFTCTVKEGSLKGKHKIYLRTADSLYDIEYTNEHDWYSENGSYVVNEIYDEQSEEYIEADRYYVGNSLSDIFEGLNMLKQVILSEGAKCR